MTDLIPPRRGEFFTSDGIPTNRFIVWIENLTTSTNEAVTEIVNIAVRESYPWDLSSSEDDQSSALQSLFSGGHDLAKEFRATTKTSNYTALSYDFINAKNGAKITFPATPGENDLVIIRNGDGKRIKLDGNGKNINGHKTGDMYKLGNSIVFHYFIDTDEWFAR